MRNQSRTARLLVMGLFAWTLASCGLTTVSLENYNTSCTAPTDCTSVFIGEVCGCNCPNAAINQADYSRYAADYSAAEKACIGSRCDVLCADVPTTCTAGVCTVVR